MRAKFYISAPNSIAIKAFREDDSGKFNFTVSPFFGNATTIKMQEVEVEAPDFFHFTANLPKSATVKQHIDLLRSTILEIQANHWGKVVIARAEVHQQQLKIWSLYKTLVIKYPNDCVFLFNSKKTGTWLGATPEVLLSAKDKVLKTMSLAGTRKKSEATTFTAKEEEEQQMVSDYIKTLLSKQKGLKNLNISAKEKAFAGDLVHFKTSFSAEIKADFEVEKLLKKLHPTPAVAGFPKKNAINFILQNENFDRSFYAGYFGLAHANEFNYYVNLRCMQVFENNYALYAGGGITKDSDPQAEYEETKAKMETLKRVIAQR